MSRNDVNPFVIAAGCGMLVVGTLALALFLSVLGAIPVYFIWNLVLVKVVAGLSPVGAVQAWAISVFIGLFRSHNTPSLGNDKKSSD